MPTRIKTLFSKYGGIVLGAVYGLLMRGLFGEEFSTFPVDFPGLFSVTFTWIVPIIIGIVPMLFASKQQLASYAYRIFSPMLAVLLFFIFTFITGVEDLICILIISLPYLAAAGFGGLLFAWIIEQVRKRKNAMYSVLFLPFLSGFVEDQFPTPIQTYEVKSSVVINASPEEIWDNVVRVREIESKEYKEGLFNYFGIPRPLYAELDNDTIGATRIGYFEGGLKFQEVVTTWERNKKVAFSIQVVPSSIRKTVFDQHMLRGDHFQFLHASYELVELDDHRTELTLSSSYRLNTKINGYGAFWGKKLLADFQNRLLVVIRNRCTE